MVNADWIVVAITFDFQVLDDITYRAQIEHNVSPHYSAVFSSKNDFQSATFANQTALKTIERPLYSFSIKGASWFVLLVAVPYRSDDVRNGIGRVSGRLVEERRLRFCFSSPLTACQEFIPLVPSY